MVKEFQYISIKEALNRTLRHPLLLDLNLDDTILYVIDFIGIFGMPKMYQDKEVTLLVKDYRALLPCDLVLINQVKTTKDDICLRSMTDTFNPQKGNSYLFKTQGRVLYTSFKDGEVLVSYKSIPVDEEGYPYLIDNAVFLKCLDLYIKKEYFTILFDTGKINMNVLNHTEQEYSWLAALLLSEFNMPSISEMESLKNEWCLLVPRTNEFEKGFLGLGDKEFIRQL